MCEQSKPFPEMIKLVSQLKVRHGFKVAVVSNESRELNAYRIRQFKLSSFVDAFISSCLSIRANRHVIYIENIPMFVQLAENLGLKTRNEQ